MCLKINIPIYTAQIVGANSRQNLCIKIAIDLKRLWRTRTKPKNKFVHVLKLFLKEKPEFKEKFIFSSIEDLK